MNLGIGSCLLRLIVLWLFISLVGCKESPPNTAASGAQAAAQGATPAPLDKASAEGTKTTEKLSPDPAKAPVKTVAPGSQEPNTDGAVSKETRDKLAKAYLEIYCAQRKKETEKLLEIYTRHGFEDPKAWTKSWTEAASDHAWVAQITQDAIRTCP